MISSKTHEIIEIPRFSDPLEAFTELFTKNNKSFLEEADNHMKFIQLKGEEWRIKLNYAWFISCGFMPYVETVKTLCLPTIDYANYLDYVFDSTIYVCPNEKERDIVFDYTLDEKCPNCGFIHQPNEKDIVRLNDLWTDFPIYAGLLEFSQNFGKIMKEVTKLNYKYARIRSTE